MKHSETKSTWRDVSSKVTFDAVPVLSVIFRLQNKLLKSRDLFLKYTHNCQFLDGDFIALYLAANVYALNSRFLNSSVLEVTMVYYSNAEMFV